jgi:hypothetical protein
MIECKRGNDRRHGFECFRHGTLSSCNNAAFGYPPCSNLAGDWMLGPVLSSVLHLADKVKK